MGRINTDVMYRNIKKMDWKNSDDPNVYIDVESRKNSITFRNMLTRLAETFIEEGNLAKAEEVLDISAEKLPIKMYKHYSLALGLIENYYKVNKPNKAQNIANELMSIFQDNIRYYATLDDDERAMNYDDLETDLLMYGNIINTATVYDKKYAEEQIDYALKTIPFDIYEQEGLALSAIEGYYTVGKPEKAKAFSQALIASYTNELEQFSKTISNSQNVMGQFNKIRPTIEFYQFVMNESEKKDSLFYQELRKGYDDAFSMLEKAMD